jgi:hypothetical protein
MAGRKLFPQKPEAVASTCLLCCPPNLRGGAFAHAVYSHYLAFTTEELEAHLREQPRWPNAANGLGYEEWLSGLLGWHRQKRAWIAADQKRFPEAKA